MTSWAGEAIKSLGLGMFPEKIGNSVSIFGIFQMACYREHAKRGGEEDVYVG